MGRVIAAQLAADGFDVAVAYVGEMDLADATVRRSRLMAAVARHSRRTSPTRSRHLLFSTPSRTASGASTLVVHTAGINHPIPLIDLDLADFDAIHRINVRARSSSTSRPRGGCMTVARSSTYRRAWSVRAAGSERLRGVQSRRRRAHPHPREGTARPRHHGQRGRAGSHRHRDVRAQHPGRRTRTAGGFAAARPSGPPGRRRQRGVVPGRADRAMGQRKVVYANGGFV